MKPKTQQNALPSAAKQRGVIIVCILAMAALGILPSVEGATLIFEPAAPSALIDFDNLGSGDSISTIGWTGSGTDYILGAAPRQPDINPSGMAIQADNSTTRRNAASPLQTITPAFTLNDTVYFSGWFNRIDAGNSGGAILLNPSEGAGYLGGYGIVDAGSNAFALYDGNGARHSSLQTAAANTWYEIALVIDLNAEDVSLSLGYLFVRNVTAGESAFTLIEDLAGISMAYTDAFNATHFGKFSATSFRNQAQIDNLAAGIGTLTPIPEPSSLPVLGTVLLLLWQFSSRSSRVRTDFSRFQATGRIH